MRPTEWAKNPSKLAEHCGVSRQAVSKWMQHPKWIFAGPSGAKWHIPTVRAWRDRILNAPETAESVDAELKRKRIEKLEEEIAGLRGTKIDRDIWERSMVGLMNSFVQELADWVNSLPDELQGLDAGQIERKLDERQRVSRERFAAATSIQLASQEDVAEVRSRQGMLL